MIESVAVVLFFIACVFIVAAITAYYCKKYDIEEAIKQTFVKKVAKGE